LHLVALVISFNGQTKRDLPEEPLLVEEEDLLLKTLPLLRIPPQVRQQCQPLVITPVTNQLQFLWTEKDLFVNVENRRSLELPIKKVRTKDESSFAVRNPMGKRDIVLFLFFILLPFVTSFVLVVDSSGGSMKLELEEGIRITPVSPLQRNIRGT
jgi:hypothetical protein